MSSENQFFLFKIFIWLPIFPLLGPCCLERSHHYPQLSLPPCRDRKCPDSKIPYCGY